VRAQRAISLITITICVLLYGCGPTKTWSAESRSPDGQWAAVAESEQWSGPGNAYDETTVYLKPLNGSQPPVQLLGFSHQYPTMNLKMEWVTPTQLHVIYGEGTKPRDHVNIDFQVVKCAGIDIFLQYLSSSAVAAGQKPKKDTSSK